MFHANRGTSAWVRQGVMRYKVRISPLDKHRLARPGTHASDGDLVREWDNTRELGGLPCAGGYIRTGVLWRGGTHDRHLPAFAQEFTRPFHFFDLRTAREIPAPEQGPGQGAVCRHHWPVADPQWVDPRRRDTAFYIESGIRLVPSLGRCFEDLLATLADGGTVFVGCRLGKDRSGLVILALGALLGIPKTALVADYVRTAQSYRASPEWIREYARKRHEDFAEVLRRLTPGAEIPAGILLGLPGSPDALRALLGIGEDLLSAARRQVAAAA